MTVPAIDAKATDMMIMTEWHRLRSRLAQIPGSVPSRQRVRKEQSADDDRDGDARGGPEDCVRAAIE